MRHLSPESEPGTAGALVKLRGGKIGVDDGLDALARGVRGMKPQAHLLRYPAGEGAKGGLQQTVLVGEVVGHQTLGYAGTSGNLRQRAADVAQIGQRVDCYCDELGTAILARFFVAGRAASR